MDLGHWKTNLNTSELTELPYGFIYVITNTISNKKYFGKKQIKSVKKLKPLKGRKNKRHFDVETDWKGYTSSSNELNEDIQKYGKDNISVHKMVINENVKRNLVFLDFLVCEKLNAFLIN